MPNNHLAPPAASTGPHSHHASLGLASRLRRLSVSSAHSSSPSPDPTPFASPATMDTARFANIGPAPTDHRKMSAAVAAPGAPPLTVHTQSPVMPELAKDTPPEMIPVLTLLGAQQTREYFSGYFMLLHDLSADGKPVADRKWVEVYGKLTGSVMSIWDASSLNDGARDGREPTPTYINITDATFKSIPSLPSPSGDLSNIIVLSTTMKNRFLMQFAAPKHFHEWTAAMRLCGFEYTCLQEAYTGALLSVKGSKLNGIRTLLSETKFRHEEWVRVRFGAGMPWRRCWTVITPVDIKKKKHMPPPGTLTFYEDPKKIKKAPLATATGGYAAYAVYPERSVLVNGSTLIKIEGKVQFADMEGGEKDTSIFLMPEQHAAVQGFETLIRFLIPVLDAFQLYGRPKRLNADKSDMRSLLFGMPSLPRCQYLDLVDVTMLVSLSGSDKWSAHQWTQNIKELLARKIATGYKGAGNLRSALSSDSSSDNSSIRKDRAVSNPNPPELLGVNQRQLQERKLAEFDREQQEMAQERERQRLADLRVAEERQAERRQEMERQQQQQQQQQQRQQQQQQQQYERQQQEYRQRQQQQRAAPQPPQVPQHGAVYGEAVSPLVPPGARYARGHERSASEGQDPNNLMSAVGPQTQPLSPLFADQSGRFPGQPSTSSESLAFVTADEDSGARSNSRVGIRESIFGSSEPVDLINSVGARNNPAISGFEQQQQPRSPASPSRQKITRRPVSSEIRPPAPIAPLAPVRSHGSQESGGYLAAQSTGGSSRGNVDMFDPTANLTPTNGSFEQLVPHRTRSPVVQSPLPSPQYPPAHRNHSPGSRSRSPKVAQGMQPPQAPPHSVPARSYSPGPQQAQPVQHTDVRRAPPVVYQQRPPQQQAQQQQQRGRPAHSAQGQYPAQGFQNYSGPQAQAQAYSQPPQGGQAARYAPASGQGPYPPQAYAQSGPRQAPGQPGSRPPARPEQDPYAQRGPPPSMFGSAAQPQPRHPSQY